MSPSELLQGVNQARAQRIGLITLLVLALVSIAAGLGNAAHHSQDFQWSGERLLLDHVDPWATYLAGDPGHRILLSQVPNYLPILYILLAPLGLLTMGTASLVWAVCNVGFALASAYCAMRAYRLRWREGVVPHLFLMATPTRNSIGNGQQSLLVLVIWCVSLLSPYWSDTRARLSGVAYFKFSFAPPMVFFLFFRRGAGAVMLSLTPIASTFLVWLWISGGHHPGELVRLALEPLAVARQGFSAAPNDPNLMSLIEPLLHRLGPALTAGVEFAVAAGLCLAISCRAYQRRGEGTVPWQMALMATMSYALFKHHPYDAVVLLLPLSHALKYREAWRAQVVLVLIGYLFFAQRLLEAAHLHPGWLRFPEFLLLMAILRLTWQIGVPQPRVEPRQGIHEVPKIKKPVAA